MNYHNICPQGKTLSSIINIFKRRYVLVFNFYLSYFRTGRWPSNVQTSGDFLYIPSATEQNTGIYTCVGTAGSRSTRKQVYIRVTNQRFIINLPDSYEASVGADVELTCSVSD